MKGRIIKCNFHQYLYKSQVNNLLLSDIFKKLKLFITNKMKNKECILKHLSCIPSNNQQNINHIFHLSYLINIRLHKHCMFLENSIYILKIMSNFFYEMIYDCNIMLFLVVSFYYFLDNRVTNNFAYIKK